MRIQTIVIILITFLLTIILMQNTGTVRFTILFVDMYVSKLVMLFLVALIAFILGVLVGRPKTVRRLGGDFPDGEAEDKPSDTLSDEDRDYIS
jgi:uncharacterized integral membrane protein